jgi:hypothetical protein
MLLQRTDGSADSTAAAAAGRFLFAGLLPRVRLYLLLLLLLLGHWPSHVHSHAEVRVFHDAQPGVKTTRSAEVTSSAEHCLVACRYALQFRTCISQPYHMSHTPAYKSIVCAKQARRLLCIEVLMFKHILTKQCTQAAQVRQRPEQQRRIVGADKVVTAQQPQPPARHCSSGSTSSSSRSDSSVGSG